MTQQSRINIPTALVKKCAELFWSKLEVPVSAINIQDLDQTDNAKRVLIFTPAGFYEFNVTDNTPVLERQCSLINLTKLVFNEPDYIEFDFSTESIRAKSSNSYNIATAVCKVVSIIFFKMPKTDLVLESKPENILSIKQLSKRPPNLLVTRVSVLQNHFKTNLTSQNLKFMYDWDRSPNGTITMEGNFDKTQSTRALTTAIGWDPNLHTLNMKNFAPEIAPNFISEIVNNSRQLHDLNIKDYKIPFSSDFSFIGGQDCKLESISLVGNHPSVVLSVIKGLEKFEGSITNFSVSDTQMSAKEAEQMVAALGRFQCFGSLKTLNIDGVPFEDVKSDTFSQILSKLPQLSDVKLYSIEGDISDHVSLLLHHSALCHLDVQKSRISGNVSSADAGPEVNFISIKECVIPPATFKSIAQTVLSTPRRKPVVLSLQSFERSLSSADFLRGLIEIGPQPNLIEFDWRQNPIDANEASMLIDFVKTQENLEFLNLRGCIRKNLTTTLPKFADYICSSRLTGIDFSPDRHRGSPQFYVDFLTSLKSATRLRSISIINMKLGDQGALAAVKLAQSLPHLAEISMDNVDLSSVTSFVSVYSQLMEISRLRAIQTPKKDLDRLDVSQDQTQVGRKIVLSLKRMNSPKTFMQRLAYYEQNGFTKDDEVKDVTQVEETQETQAIGDQLVELQKIMGTMIGTIEDGFGTDPFKLSMALLKTLHLRDELSRDVLREEYRGIIDLINQELDDDDKL